VDGARTVLMVSDNNFSPAQRMAFVLLRETVRRALKLPA